MCDLEAEYVIVGGGAAGCLVASKLHKGGHSVIVIEAGENRSQDQMIRDSTFAGIEFGLEENATPIYLYALPPTRNGSLVSARGNPSTAIEAGCSTITVPGFNDAPASDSPETVGIYSTGRLIGGGSSINGLQFVEGTVYDRWAEVGGSQWAKEEVYRRFKELETYHGLSGESETHGKHGDLNIRQTPSQPTVMAQKFVAALAAGGIATQIPNDDYNDPETPIGSFTRWQLFEYPDGSRASSDVSFLPKEVLSGGSEANEGTSADEALLVLFKCTALKVIWSKERDKDGKYVAKGVSVLHNSEARRVYAQKRIIVCLGIFSAEFLQRSGVGPKSLLSCLGVPLIYDNPNVGRHMKNHLLVPIMFSAPLEDVGIPSEDGEALYTGGCFLGPLLPEDDSTLRGYQLIGAWPEPGVFMILLIYLQPHSEGLVEIQSSDPLIPSLPDNNYLGSPLDVQAYIRAIREYIVPLSAGFQTVDPRYKLLEPSLATISDDNLITEYIKTKFDHTHHWQASCRMGRSSKDGVVNGHGEVFGVSNLSIADISIAPVASDGNTCAPAYAVAATIAEHLLCED